MVQSLSVQTAPSLCSAGGFQDPASQELLSVWCLRQLGFLLFGHIALKSTSMVITSHVLVLGSEITHSVLMCVRLAPIKPESLPQYLLIFSLSFSRMHAPPPIKSLLYRKSQIILCCGDVDLWQSEGKPLSKYKIPCKRSREIAGMECVLGVAQKTGYYPKPRLSRDDLASHLPPRSKELEFFCKLIWRYKSLNITGARCFP